MAPSTMQTVTSCTTSAASRCSSGTQAQRARTPRRFLRRPVIGFTRSSFKKPVIMLHESRTSASRTQAAQTLPSCSTGTHLSLLLQSLSLPTLRQARTRGVWQLLCFVDSCTVLPFLVPSPPPPVTLCSGHIHNVLAEKRDASTDLLRRLHARMVQHNVDFIGEREGGRGTST